MTTTYELHDKQCLALESPANMLLYGGAGGGGKSHFGRIAAILAAVEVPGLPVYLVRQRYNDLKKNHFVGATSFPVLLADFIKAKKVEIADVEIRFANGPEPSKPFDGGSRIIGVQCVHDNDLEKIHGAELGLVIFEESTQLLQRHIEFYLSRVRIPQVLREKIKGTPWEGKLPGAIFTTNPIGKSLSFHKQLWIDGKEPYRVYKETQTIIDDKGRPVEITNHYQFIPASLDDNPDIDKSEYIASLSHLSPELQDAILRGLWDVKFGNFYPELSAPKHVVPHFTPPPHWPRFSTHDWGSNAPAATIWWAVADGETGNIPRGSLYAYKEWYVVDPKDSTKGLGLSNTELAKGIAERSEQASMICFTDSIPFQDRGHAKPMWMEYRDAGVFLKPAEMANKARSASMVRTRLVGEHGIPRLFFSDQCPHTFRTLAELGHHATDRDKPDGSEDHLPDCVMHACRMWTHVVDSPEDERARLQEALAKPEPVTLRGLDPELSSILGR
jgi:hypothetical protein